MVFSNSISEQSNLRYLDRIQTSVEQLSQSLDEVLIISRSEEPTEPDLDRCCRNLVAEIRAIVTCLKKESTFKHTVESQPVLESIFPSHPQLREVFDFIEANYRQPITLCDVAEAVGYSPAYLTDLVRRQTGQTVNRWIIQRRMAEARSLLIETHQSVDSIAQAVGYFNAGHFFRQFRQYHSTTPQAWRKAQRTEDQR
jgi:AraC-like DNA-binding protein